MQWTFHPLAKTYGYEDICEKPFRKISEHTVIVFYVGFNPNPLSNPHWATFNQSVVTIQSTICTSIVVMGGLKVSLHLIRTRNNRVRGDG